MVTRDIKFKEKIEHVVGLLAQADAVLIGAGSGLSADAGIDYADPRFFAKAYPAMLQYGYTTNAEVMKGLAPSPCPELFWGYYLTHANNMRFGSAGQTVYRHLLDLVRQKNYFIVTTNVDAFFSRNGFAEDRIYTPQGDYGRIQCKKPFAKDTWPSNPIIKGLLPLVDPLTGKLPEEFVPTCPICGGAVTFNVRMDAWFVETPYAAQQMAYTHWIQANRNKRLLLMDIGTGFHTPVWIRRPFEKITCENPGTHLIRINKNDAHVPDNIAHRSSTFANRAIEVITAVANHCKTVD